MEPDLARPCSNPPMATYVHLVELGQACTGAMLRQGLRLRSLTTSRRRSSTSMQVGREHLAEVELMRPSAAPHVGHLYTLVLTDILKRWQVLKGRRAILSTGTDEHGMKVGMDKSSLDDSDARPKIQQAASRAGVDPRPFCDAGAEVFKVGSIASGRHGPPTHARQGLAGRANILNDHFLRTTDPDHREAVEYAWVSLIMAVVTEES